MMKMLGLAERAKLAKGPLRRLHCELYFKITTPDPAGVPQHADEASFDLAEVMGLIANITALINDNLPAGALAYQNTLQHYTDYYQVPR